MKDLVYKNSLLFLLIALITGCGSDNSGSASQSATFNLTILIDGLGTGTVTSSPAGIDCGTDCSESYTENTIVTLTASRATGSLFVGWSGSCTGTDSCSVTMDAAKSVIATFVEYSVDCSLYATYTPTTAPLITLSFGGAATTTVIVMHGKAGSPLNPYLLPLYADLSNADYDVIAPYMPWSGTLWNGSMCEAMNYIDSLAAEEAAKGNNVIIAGHSMGGAHSLIYGATSSPTKEVRGIITLAPGHFPHLENIFQTAIASSIVLAEDMVVNGNGDDLNTFDTLNPGAVIQITASANDYLSYHALYQYPDINDVLLSIKLPVVWLAGIDDPLTTFYDMPALFNRITSQNSKYEVVNGDHLSMVSNSETPIVVWLHSLGL